ncbi:hypothetical protein ACJX0J_025571 [Zea mays]
MDIRHVNSKLQFVNTKEIKSQRLDIHKFERNSLQLKVHFWIGGEPNPRYIFFLDVLLLLQTNQLGFDDFSKVLGYFVIQLEEFQMANHFIKDKGIPMDAQICCFLVSCMQNKAQELSLILDLTASVLQSSFVDFLDYPLIIVLIQLSKPQGLISDNSSIALEVTMRAWDHMMSLASRPSDDWIDWL